MTKNKIAYPVILRKEPNDVFVRIPDIEGGFTQGDDEQDALLMAQDAIGNLLDDIDEQNYPKPSKISDIKLTKGDILVVVPIDMAKFKNKYPKK